MALEIYPPNTLVYFGTYQGGWHLHKEPGRILSYHPQREYYRIRGNDGQEYLYPPEWVISVDEFNKREGVK